MKTFDCATIAIFIVVPVCSVLGIIIFDINHSIRYKRIKSWCRLVHNGYTGSGPHMVINPRIANMLWRIL